MNPVTVTQGVIDLTFHQVVAAVIRVVLARYDITILEVVSAPHERAFQDLSSGRTQLLVGWLPGSHRAYLEPFKDDILVLGEAESSAPVYDPYCIWGVPDYVPIEVVRSITDLAKPEVVTRFVRTVQGINAGAGISRFSKEIIARYGLDLRFVEGDIPTCCAAFEEAYARREWVIVPLWHPQYLHSRFNIRALEDPDDLLRARTPDAARIIISSSLAANLSPDTNAALRGLRIGNAGVARMDYLHAVEGLSPDDAAARWMDESGCRI
ncbi:ABC-type glycine betaine transport system, substrate-binding domain-containing protein [Fomitopsis serialis]|uniref:ABC-type glycine betaine transport system, substrate-binding domain-containing protein n=1 Tax=Fomitopsis serialis TaxID=139415 RepID=UPI002007B71B|nr:ABC-type glycine betaine transport system, substrate-binding domain-containing protein [Neoantrodia serialis]KAH9919344.1 ABC-type glycine betaine transport system, substrate-binding domain-containing protein [Neoantrodia serialis]